MKILHLVSSRGYYGKESVIINLCSALEKLGCCAEVGAFLNSHAPNEEVVSRAHSQRLLARTFACDGRVDLRTVKSIQEHILSHQIDLVHTHDNKANIYGYLAARWARRPVVATCHLWSSTTMIERIYGGFDRFVLRYFDGVIGVSPPIANTLRESGIAECKVAVIANGIDFSPLLRVEEGSSRREFGRDLTIGIVGRLVPQKGHRFFFAAGRTILKKFPAARFVVLGEGPDRQQLENLAQELGIAASVYFAGYRGDMPSVYADLDLVVMPSLDEGLPMTLLEAMAARRAVVASAVGAVPEVIHHGRTGLLVEPSNVDDLEQAMLLLLSDASLCNQIAQNARESVLHFSSERMAANYLDFYRGIGHLLVPLLPARVAEGEQYSIDEINVVPRGGHPSISPPDNHPRFSSNSSQQASNRSTTSG
jgi:glycosyltransferase involved in cell wall biosynthesis